jgi:peptidoglycan/LPS O-acetylase OafA/YrhL
MTATPLTTFLTPLSIDSSSIAARLRDNNFDSLRLIFALMVVVYHVGRLSQASGLGWTSSVSATFAVQAFFVVSGFLVTMSFENSSSIRSYALKRLRRIAPAYVLVVILAALGLSLISDLSAHEYFTSGEFRRYIAYNLALSNFSAPTLPGVFQSNYVTAVNGALWTIKVEVAFYCLVPFIVWGVRRFGYNKVLLTMFLASVIWKVAFSTAATVTQVELYAKLAKQLPGQLCFFAGGAWAYYRTREERRIGVHWAVLGVVIYALSDGIFYDVLAPLAVTAIVYWAAIAGPRLPAVGKVGDFSYGIYLCHFPIVQTLISVGAFRWSTLLGSSLVVITVATCSVISWFFVEKPLLHRAVAQS